MTAEEARDRLKFEMSIMERDYEFDPEHDETYNAMAIAVEALEKQNKYRWHDLRKNPDDLPVYEKEYLCLVEASALHTGKKGYGYAIIKRYRIIELKSYVVKWKELEPFEEVE